MLLLTDEQIAAWIESLQIHLTSVLYPHQVSRLVEPLLQNSPDTPAYQHANEELRIQFEYMLTTTDLFEVVEVYHWLPVLQMVLVAEQEQIKAFLSTYLILTVNIAIAVIATLTALFSAQFTAHSIVAPLADLAHIATRIADGDLKLTAPVQGQDEVGLLAAAFNRITARLREVISNPEQKVKEQRFLGATGPNHPQPETYVDAYGGATSADSRRQRNRG